MRGEETNPKPSSDGGGGEPPSAGGDPPSAGGGGDPPSAGGGGEPPEEGAGGGARSWKLVSLQEVLWNSQSSKSKRPYLLACDKHHVVLSPNLYTFCHISCCRTYLNTSCWPFHKALERQPLSLFIELYQNKI
ncbi:hypothetical protein Tco_0212781 [Tanacetum coccineum]